MSDFGLALVGVALAVAIIGIVVPVLPGALLAWGAILVWALVERSTAGWAVVGVATLAIGASQVVKYLVPGRRLRDAGVPNRSIVVGVLVAVVGFFVVPFVGLFLGFPLGVYIEERRRLGRHDPAWASTRAALKAVGLSLLIELAGTMIAAGAWLGAVIAG
jgi:uncharacterized protein YqgC (DUF456 family)